MRDIDTHMIWEMYGGNPRDPRVRESTRGKRMSPDVKEGMIGTITEDLYKADIAFAGVPNYAMMYEEPKLLEAQINKSIYHPKEVWIEKKIRVMYTGGRHQHIITTFPNSYSELLPPWSLEVDKVPTVEKGIKVEATENPTYKGELVWKFHWDDNKDLQVYAQHIQGKPHFANENISMYIDIDHIGTSSNIAKSI